LLAIERALTARRRRSKSPKLVATPPATKPPPSSRRDPTAHPPELLVSDGAFTQCCDVSHTNGDAQSAADWQVSPHCPLLGTQSTG